MKITRLRLVLPVVSLLLLFGAYFFGAGQDVELDTKPVRGNVSALVTSAAGNIGVQTGPDGILMIDDQFASHAPDIEAALAKLGEGTPIFLINTHWHGDHTGGNEHFGRAATIVAHRNVRRRLAGDGVIGGRVQEEESPAAALPVVTYEDGVSIHFNGEEVRLIHVPRAHTDGDTVVWFTGSNVIHLGDLFFQVGYPFVDVESGGNAFGMIEGLEGILAQVPENIAVISGHGEVSDLDGLREYLGMLKEVTGRVRELAAENFTVDDMMDAGVTEDFDERWTWGFINGRKYVESVVASLD